jgi:tRNA(Ile)-lysidine synthase
VNREHVSSGSDATQTPDAVGPNTRRAKTANLVTVVRRGLREADVKRGARLVLAVSGGPDSMALLDALTRFDHGLSLIAVGVDHGLRAGAAAELAQAKAYASARGVEMRIANCHVVAGSNLQARARRERYTALRAAAIAVDANHIATAHHQEDRAETVLIRMLRNAPFAGLGILPIADGDLIRPMLRASRQCIDTHNGKFAVATCHDPSNQNPRFLRNRVRAEVLPLLRELNPQITNYLCALADESLALMRLPETARIPALPAPYNALPQRTQAQLQRARSSQSLSARVWLPNGQVVRVDATGAFITEPPAANEKRPGRRFSLGTGSPR